MCCVRKMGRSIGVAGVKKIEYWSFRLVVRQYRGNSVGGRYRLSELKNKGNFSLRPKYRGSALKSGCGLNAKYRDGVAVFVLPQRVLMVVLSWGGQKFSFRPFKTLNPWCFNNCMSLFGILKSNRMKYLFKIKFSPPFVISLLRCGLFI